MKNTVILTRYEYAMACLGMKIAGTDYSVEEKSVEKKPLSSPSTPAAPVAPVVVEEEPNLSC